MKLLENNKIEERKKYVPFVLIYLNLHLLVKNVVVL